MRLLLAQLLTAAMVVAGLLVGFHYDWPDYVHTDYGFPLVWATHTESTIMGQADIWLVSPINLITNISIWTILSIVVVAIIGALKRQTPLRRHE